MLKKLVVLLVFLLGSVCNVYAISAQSAVVIDAQSGRIIFEKNAYQKRGMASTTKIMTAIVALEKCKPDEIVTVSYKASATEGSSMYLASGEKITVENLLYGLMLNSGNDAATALAEHIAKDIPSFAKLMNEKARKLALHNTSFANPHGLDNENHYSTAYDMAMLTKYALDNEDFKKIVSTKTHTTETETEGKYRYLTNHNKLLTKYEWCKGVKTGFTKKCGRCLVSYAEKDGVGLIAVTLNAPDDWNDHITMFEQAFSKYKNYVVLNKNDYIATVNVEGSKEKNIKLYCDYTVSLTLTEDEYKNLKIRYDYPNSVDAPIYIGQQIGTVNVMSNNRIVASSPIVSRCGVSEKTETLYIENLCFLFNNLLSFFTNNI